MFPAASPLQRNKLSIHCFWNTRESAIKCLQFRRETHTWHRHSSPQAHGTAAFHGCAFLLNIESFFTQINQLVLLVTAPFRAHAAAGKAVPGTVPINPRVRTAPAALAPSPAPRTPLRATTGTAPHRRADSIRPDEGRPLPTQRELFYWFSELQSHQPRQQLRLSEPHSHHVFLSSKSRPTGLVNGQDQFLRLLDGTNIAHCSSDALHHPAEPVWESGRDGSGAGSDGGALSGTRAGPGRELRSGSRDCSVLPRVCAISLPQRQALSFSTVACFSCVTI